MSIFSVQEALVPYNTSLQASTCRYSWRSSDNTHTQLAMYRVWIGNTAHAGFDTGSIKCMYYDLKQQCSPLLYVNVSNPKHDMILNGGGEIPESPPHIIP